MAIFLKVPIFRTYFFEKKTAVFFFFLKVQDITAVFFFFKVQDIPFTLKYNGCFCLDVAMAKLLRSVFRNQLYGNPLFLILFKVQDIQFTLKYNGYFT